MMEAQKYPGQEKQVLEYYEKNKEASQNLAGPLFEEKVFDFICEMAEIKEKKYLVKTCIRKIFLIKNHQKNIKQIVDQIIELINLHPIYNWQQSNQFIFEKGSKWIILNQLLYQWLLNKQQEESVLLIYTLDY